MYAIRSYYDSDIDLLILFDKTIPPDVEAFVQELLYPLWDARFEVGYAVRNINECIKMSFERFRNNFV